MQLIRGGNGLGDEAGWRERTGAPAFLVPAGPADLLAHYDLTISHPNVDEVMFTTFDRWLGEAAAERGLSCGLIHQAVLPEAIRRLSTGQMTIGFHLDYFALWHQPGDLYARLAFAVEDAGGRSVNAPGRAQAFTDKAIAHAELVRRGLGTPATMLVRPWTADTDAWASAARVRLRLDEPGACVYVKPANGFAGRGIVRTERTDPEGLAAALAQARRYDAGDTYLIQREVRPPLLSCEDGCQRPAYWRILYCMGEWIFFWWGSQDQVGQGRPSYRLVSPAEMRRHRLQPVLQYAKALAEWSGLEWFSTELCLGEGPEPSRFTVTGPDGRDLPVLAIDYINDQCDVDIESRWAASAPDDVVYHLAHHFADAAWQVRRAGLRPGSVTYRRAA
jgi:hypothetical protein